jgi:hypothetical protein
MVDFVLRVFLITLSPWAVALTLKFFSLSKGGLILAARELAARFERRELCCEAAV